jgi:hypothetical protein
MNPSTATLTKHKSKAHTSSDSSEGSPAAQPILKRATMGSVTKDDLTALRGGLKQDLKEELVSHLQPLLGKMKKHLGNRKWKFCNKICELTISSFMDYQFNKIKILTLCLKQ